MPSRLVREVILRSEKVNKLSFEAEVFYRRLLSVVDDFGRYSANPTLLRSACYPLKIDHIKDRQIEKWLQECFDAELLGFYDSTGKKFLEVLNVNTPRASKSRYPTPDNNCLQVKTKGRKCAEAPLSNTNTYPNTNTPDSGENPQIQNISESKINNKGFSKPSLVDVTEYCQSRKNGIDPEGFIAFYESKGWRVGNQTMKDWRAAIITWEKRTEHGRTGKPGRLGSDSIPGKYSSLG